MTTKKHCDKLKLKRSDKIMKLIRIFLLLIIVSFVVGVGTAFNGKHNEITIDKLNEQILSTEEVNIKTPITELLTEIPNEDKEEKS